jgi:iron(III) transport system ATP-binding protein
VSDRIIVMNAARIAQDGAPRQLYELPASRFVADFIGDANLLAVTVRRLDAVMAAVELGPLTLRLPHRGAPDGPAELSVRPQAIRLQLPGSGLPARILKAAYLGSHMEYEVSIDGQPAEIFVIAADVANPLPAGTDIGVTFDETALAIVPPP